MIVLGCEGYGSVLHKYGIIASITPAADDIIIVHQEIRGTILYIYTRQRITTQDNFIRACVDIGRTSIPY